jgi:NMD protein affecting ribosome stability and mRNA decay
MPGFLPRFIFGAGLTMAMKHSRHQAGEGGKNPNPNPRYFEGILQLRNPNDEVIGFMLSLIEARPGVSIAKEVRVKNGVDVYLSSQRFLQSLGRKLMQRFGGTLKSSRRIHTRNRQNSRDVYRVTVLYEAPLASRHDVIKTDGRLICLTSLDRMLRGTDLKTGKSVSLPTKGAEYEVLQKHRTKVSKVYPHVEVLHPETYQSVPVSNNPKGAVPAMGENVEVVLEDGVWLV